MENTTLLNSKNVRSLVMLVLASATIALLVYAHTTYKMSQNQYGPTTINVRGEGEVLAKPDIGSFSFSVRAEGEDAAEAQEKSAEINNAIIAYLKEQGVEEKDIKTQYYNLNPKYRYEERVCPFGSYCPPGEPIIDGYEVSQNVTVKVRDLDKSGDLITGVGERGASAISGLSFPLAATANLEAEAREIAIADAKDKAEKLVKDLDSRIVKLVGFYEEEYYPMPYGYGGDMLATAVVSMDAAPASPELPTGENTIRKVVNITYEIR